MPRSGPRTVRTGRRAGAAVPLLVATALLAAFGLGPADASAVDAATAATVVGVPGVLTGLLPGWAHGTPKAAVASGTSVPFVLQLAGRHTAELHQLASEVSNPSSARYRHFLSPARYRARYAPDAGAVDTVTSVVRAAGLDVVGVSADRSFVTVQGPAGVVGDLFSTTFGLFDVAGSLLRSPLSAPVLPTALRGLVSNVAGLAQDQPLRPTHVLDTPDAAPSPAFVNARPCSAFYGQKTATAQPSYEGRHAPYAICGYTPKQLRAAYGVPATTLTGKGASVGIVDAFASPTILSDANTYATKHGDEPFAKGQFADDSPPLLSSLPEDPTGLLLDPQGWAGEETLDVEAVHAMAPDAKVVYQGALSPFGPFLYVALAQLVEGGKVQVVSNSYGTGDDSPLPTDQLVFDQVTTEAASLGVTIDFSSGDDGDQSDPSAGGARTADFPATSPGVTAVGGTSLHIAKDGSRTLETYWGTRKSVLTADGSAWDLKDSTFSGAGGGGVSTQYAEPAWQKGVVPDDLATFGGVKPGRVEPDVSMDADSTTGMLVGQTETFAGGKVAYGEFRIGGTSLSCPLFSGMLALAVQARGGKGLGLVTPTLYKAASTPSAAAKVFYDPDAVSVDKAAGDQSTIGNVRSDYADPTDTTSEVSFSLRTLGNLGTLHALPGYDDSTGLGAPRAKALVAALKRAG